MTCHDCIARANEFIDETLGSLERARHAAHLERCAGCARYHRVLRKGLRLAQDLGEIQPSDQFAVRLRGRLRGLEDEQASRDRAVLSGASVVIAVAGLVALAAWAPIWQEAAEARASMALVDDAVPGLPPEWPSRDWWYGGPGGSVIPVGNRSAAFPGPYSPLVVQPPVVNGANRTAGPLYGDGE